MAERTKRKPRKPARTVKRATIIKSIKPTGDCQRRLTEKEKQQLLDSIAAGSTLKEACAFVNVSRQAIHLLRKRDAAFAHQFNKAVEIGQMVQLDDIESAMIKRSVEGTLRPVFYKGKPCGAIKQYSDGVLLARARALAPEKYGDHTTVSAKLDASASVELDPYTQHLLAMLIDALKPYPEAQAAACGAIEKYNRWAGEQSDEAPAIS